MSDTLNIHVLSFWVYFLQVYEAQVKLIAELRSSVDQNLTS